MSNKYKGVARASRLRERATGSIGMEAGTTPLL